MLIMVSASSRFDLPAPLGPMNTVIGPSLSSFTSLERTEPRDPDFCQLRCHPGASFPSQSVAATTGNLRAPAS